MKRYKFRSYKITDNIDLTNFLSYFPSIKHSPRDNWICMEPSQIEQVLQYSAEEKLVYLFDFGSISFVNFQHDDVQRFIAFLKTMIDDFEDSYLFSYQENYRVYINPEAETTFTDNHCVVPENDQLIVLITATVLGKSIALNQIEYDVSHFLDQYEGIVKDLERGKLAIRRKQVLTLTSQILRFELNMIANVKVFDRPYFRHNSLIHGYYDQLSELYEFSHRFSIIKNKLEDLDEIKSTFYDLSHNKASYNLYVAEIFLLSIFAVANVFIYILDPLLLVNFVRGFLF